MSATDNKKLMEDIFAGLAKGNTDPLFEAMADDMQWTWMGSGPSFYCGRRLCSNGGQRRECYP